MTVELLAGMTVAVGSRWMCRLFGGTGKWVEVVVLETDVLRKDGLQCRVRMACCPSSASWYVDPAKRLIPVEVTP